LPEGEGQRRETPAIGDDQPIEGYGVRLRKPVHNLPSQAVEGGRGQKDGLARA
jgi:hypothetical protein